MSWIWTLEHNAYVLRLAPAPPGLARFGLAGRSLCPGAAPWSPGPESVRLEQVHGAEVALVDAAGPVAACDGAVTRVPGLTLTVRVADCLPVLLASPLEGIALVHAGWRGLVAGVVEAALAHFSDPAEVHVVAGPAIGPCCFEVGPEVAARFPEAAVHTGPAGRPHVDLDAALRRRLAAASVRAERIAPRAPCTRCHQHLLHSHRGSGGAPGRNVLFASAARGLQEA